MNLSDAQARLLGDYLQNGGFDIVTTEMQEDGSWTPPVNIGVPLNTVDDDVFFVTTTQSQSQSQSQSHGGGGIRQCSGDLDVLYEDARQAHEKLRLLFASEWREWKRVDHGKTVLSVPVEGTTALWVDKVVDPGDY